jgi:hypothetical protein
MKYGEATTWPEAVHLYQESKKDEYKKTQNNYLSAKRKFLKNNIFSNKNATFKFTQENGLTPAQMDMIYSIEQQSIGG